VAVNANLVPKRVADQLKGGAQRQTPTTDGTMRQIIEKILRDNGNDAKEPAVSQLVTLNKLLRAGF